MTPFENALKERRAPSADVILYGPRGNGKTVLLNDIGKNLSLLGVNAVGATPKGKAASRQALARALAPSDGWPALLRRLADGAGVASASRLSLFGVRFNLGERKLSAEQMLASQCRETPLALLVDEAHMLPAKLGGELLDASQNIRSGGAPFLLVLAGTPEIMRRLQEMGATHWERARKLPIGRLDPGEDRDALMKPLQDCGGTADEGALPRILHAANRYPYFLQEMGAAIVAALNAQGAKRIDEAIAESALAAFSEIKNEFYDTRREELKNAGLLPYAEAVARAFQDGDERLPDEAVEDVLNNLCIGQGKNAGAAKMRMALVDRGLVWRRSGGYEPGIPSLLAHLAENASAS